ncbi:MAG: 30S ribosomal protein S11 [Candidatus Colwellbacteria bacterium]|nr:30S ribosomal protein S11 [Candidatus Colwellbacteria bacterium]
MGKKRIIQKGEDASKQGGAVSAASPPGKKRKTQRAVEVGRIYIRSSYNNTVMTVTDDKGNVMAWATSGALGFSGPKKATPFAASKVTAAIAEKVSKTGPHKVEVLVSGIGPGRDSAIRSLANQGFDIISIRDITPIPHNGPKAPKPRRV